MLTGSSYVLTLSLSNSSSCAPVMPFSRHASTISFMSMSASHAATWSTVHVVTSAGSPRSSDVLRCDDTSGASPSASDCLRRSAAISSCLSHSAASPSSAAARNIRRPPDMIEMTFLRRSAVPVSRTSARRSMSESIGSISKSFLNTSSVLPTIANMRRRHVRASSGPSSRCRKPRRRSPAARSPAGLLPGESVEGVSSRLLRSLRRSFCTRIPSVRRNTDTLSAPNSSTRCGYAYTVRFGGSSNGTGVRRDFSNVSTSRNTPTSLKHTKYSFRCARCTTSQGYRPGFSAERHSCSTCDVSTSSRWNSVSSRNAMSTASLMTLSTVGGDGT
eukprot:Unigene8591_Nuclearia_a/m.26304 Unigene8591_Nuclearia_a/g.26304  ORF Unigene8591_Nuclearia_a/g.26304 Unigene8591_Nuclearia_a/m.26304 type:complete len:331 (+) Unigene8591_Nuclearia_a:463-1455(+)